MRISLAVLLLLMCSACSTEVPPSARIPLGTLGLEVVVEPGKPLVGEFFTVRLPEDAKEWNFQIPDGVEGSRSLDGSIRMRTFFAGALSLSIKDRPEILVINISSSLTEADSPYEIEGVVGLRPTIQQRLTQLLPNIWIATGGFLVLGVSWWLWRIHRARVALIPALPPAKRALDSIKTLESSLPTNEPEAIVFLDKLSDVIRKYLEEALGTTASRSTTPEFLADSMQHLPLPTRKPVEQLLQASDRAKFARTAMPAYACGIVESAREIIELTEPKSEQPR